MSLSRRALLAAPLLLLPAGAPGRIATTELILTETALTLGLVPVAAGNLPLYRRLVGQPALPEGIADLGPLNEPNMELLQWLRPDAILASDWQRAVQALLERIAPVHWLPSFPVERPPLENARWLLSAIGRMTGRAAEADRVLRAFDDELAALASALGHHAEPVRIVRLMEDGRHAMIFAPGSLVDGVMRALGLRNAEPAANPWGARMVGLDRLALTEGPVLAIGGLPAAGGPILRAMLGSGRLRLTALPAVFPAGGTASALRLARGIAAALERPA